MRRFRPEPHSLRPETNAVVAAWPIARTPPKPTIDATTSSSIPPHNLDLQLSSQLSSPINNNDDHSTHLQLSIGSSHSGHGEKNDHHLVHDYLTRSCTLTENNNNCHYKDNPSFISSRLREQSREILRQAMEERKYAEEARQHAKRQIVLAEQEFVNAKRMRQQAQVELDKAHALREHAMEKISSTILEITCYACKHKFQATTTTTTSKGSEDE